MARSVDTSALHFEWLTANRSRNQRSTVNLYALIESHEIRLSKSASLQLLAQEFAAICFSLWRAVFLSDLTGRLGDQLGDVTSFLQSLIAHNSVLYQTDFNAREWAFAYYLENANSRLIGVSRENPLILPKYHPSATTGTPKDAWSNAQAALDLAIANFAKALAAHDPA